MPELVHKKTADIDSATSLMTPTTELGLSTRKKPRALHNTMQVDSGWLGPLQRSPGMGKGGDW